jgi:hypothetical protein
MKSLLTCGALAAGWLVCLGGATPLAAQSPIQRSDRAPASACLALVTSDSVTHQVMRRDSLPWTDSTDRFTDSTDRFTDTTDRFMDSTAGWGDSLPARARVRRPLCPMPTAKARS